MAFRRVDASMLTFPSIPRSRLTLGAGPGSNFDFATSSFQTPQMITLRQQQPCSSECEEQTAKTVHIFHVMPSSVHCSVI